MLGNPKIAEANVSDFNAEFPHLAISAQDEVRLDDGLSGPEGTDSEGQGAGNDLLAQLNIYRARMIKKDMWLPAVLDFSRHWERYKRDECLMDFQDLIERAIDLQYPPNNATIGIFDEVQDFTPIQLKLIRRWAKYMHWIIMSGDDDQTLYSFTGATPEAFLNPPITDEFKKILRQSYRVPVKSLNLANTIIKKLKVREPKEYRPRDHEGKIYSSKATWKRPDDIIPVIRGYIKEGKRVMVLTTCSYMLAPLIAQLRDRGIPFSNIYKPTRGDWNPIRRKQTGNAGSYGRLVAYMQPSGPEFQGTRLWTPAQLESWTEPVKVDGNFQKGAKKKLKDACKAKDVDAATILAIMLEAMTDDCFDNSVAGDLDWFLKQITPAKQKSFEFPTRVYRECGEDGPEMAKLCTVGTIHCSPPDEPVLTTNGWIPISELDNRLHGLASYHKKTNDLVWGTTNQKTGYKEFTIEKRPYSGPLITLRTERSKTRITPNHHIPVKFNEDFFEKYVVYLMQRGSWFRVGICVSGHRPYRSGGVGGRLATEQADAAWILAVCKTREEALHLEAKFQIKYGLTGLTFESASARSLSSKELHEAHMAGEGDSRRRAEKLLTDMHMLIECPLVTRSPLKGEIQKVNTRNVFVTAAGNILDSYMDVLVPRDSFLKRKKGQKNKADFLKVSASSEMYEGDVYSMDILPHHYYISGGIIVHNSVKGAESDVVIVFPDLSLRGAQSYITRTGEQFDQILRQFYVAVTRTRDVLILCQGMTRGMFFDDYK